jgi:Zn-dependent metalloprotease
LHTTKEDIMRKLIIHSGIVVMFLLIAVGIDVSELSPQTEKQVSAFDRLKQLDSTIQVRWDRKAGIPTRLVGKLSERIDANASEIAMRFFRANGTIFGMADANKELSAIRMRTDQQGWSHVKLQQVFKSINVENSTLLVHINSNKEIRIVTGYYLPNIDIDTLARIRSADAIGTARQDLNPRKELARVPVAERVVYSYNGKPYLAWKTRLISVDPLGEFIYYVDAHTGQVIDKYNDLKFALDRKTYDANKGTTLPGTLRRSEGQGDIGDHALDSAHINAGIVYNYYLAQTPSRDSYDDAGATIVSSVHYDVNYNNAFWSPGLQQMVYGDGDGNQFIPLSLSLDVVAHELTHAVTDRESQLVYRVQSGALNESLSDIFGVLIDARNWMLGEDVYTPGTPGDALRYLDNPPLGNQPDHMDNYVVTASDNGGVHINSGIPNKAAYLMAAGGTHHGITVTAMGRQNLGKVFYLANTDYLQSNDDFLKARHATIDAAIELFGASDSKVNTVKSAWAAVGVGPFGVSLTPSEINVSRNGSQQLTAEVTLEGEPVAGATVTFASDNTGIATVSPGSSVTGADGKAVTSIGGLSSCASTQVTATANQGTNTAVSKLHVNVPTTSDVGLILLILLLFVLILRSAMKRGLRGS